MFIRVNLLHGLLTSGISEVDTEISSGALEDAPIVSDPDRIRIVVNPLAINGSPEIMDIIDHELGSNTAVVERAVEDADRFPAVAHGANTSWAAADTIETMDQSATIGSARPVAFEWSPVGSSSEWDIEHGLGFRPSGIIVVDSGGTTMYGFVVEYPSLDRIILHFNAPFVGTAFLS